MTTQTAPVTSSTAANHSSTPSATTESTLPLQSTTSQAVVSTTIQTEEPPDPEPPENVPPRLEFAGGADVQVDLTGQLSSQYVLVDVALGPASSLFLVDEDGKLVGVDLSTASDCPGRCCGM
ncbi:MAG: hypothetical protein ACC652_11820 [Acidimicrobiales bacterium]